MITLLKHTLYLSEAKVHPTQNILLNNKIFLGSCLILVLSFLSACRKDVAVITPPPQQTDCPPDTNTRCSWAVTSFTLGPVQRTSPVFNPNNHNELLYHERDLAAHTQSIILYNIQTKTKKTIITSPSTLYNIKWAKNNWIIFVDYGDKKLYKVHSDGNDLTGIANFSGLSSATLSPFNEILVNTKFVNPVGCYLMNFDGIIYDTLESIHYSLGDISPSFEEPQLACYESSLSLPYMYTSISVMSFPSFVSEHLYIPYEEKYRASPYYSLAWHPNCEDIYYASYRDIQKFNVKQYKHNIVKKGCTYDNYGIVAVSPDGKKLAAEAVHWYFDDLCRLCYETDIVFMNIDGTNEQYPFR